MTFCNRKRTSRDSRALLTLQTESSTVPYFNVFLQMTRLFPASFSAVHHSPPALPGILSVRELSHNVMHCSIWADVRTRDWRGPGSSSRPCCPLLFRFQGLGFLLIVQGLRSWRRSQHVHCPGYDGSTSRQQNVVRFAMQAVRSQPMFHRLLVWICLHCCWLCGMSIALSQTQLELPTLLHVIFLLLWQFIPSITHPKNATSAALAEDSGQEGLGVPLGQTRVTPARPFGRDGSVSSTLEGLTHFSMSLCLAVTRAVAMQRNRIWCWKDDDERNGWRAVQPPVQLHRTCTYKWQLTWGFMYRFSFKCDTCHQGVRANRGASVASYSSCNDDAKTWEGTA